MTLYWPPEMGWWAINGESMIWAGAAPVATSDGIEKLWTLSRPLEIDNHVQPEVDSRLPREVFADEARHEIHYHLSGLVMPDGSPAPNLAAGFFANHFQLCTRVGDPSSWPTRRGVPSTLMTPNEVLMGADIQAYVSPIGRESGTIANCVVSVVIPRGRFLPVEP